ncbi:MAG: magnesium transporter [Hymenobacter sp.]
MQKRAGWLVVLFLGELLTASAMQFFEGELQKAIVLVQFIPPDYQLGRQLRLAQATSLIIRAMALGEVHPERVVAGAAPRAGGRPPAGPDSGPGGLRAHRHLAEHHAHLRAALAAGGHSRWAWRWWASCCGAASRAPCCRSSCGELGLDPATSSAPFVATLVDVTGLIIYFTRGAGDAARHAPVAGRRECV